MNKTRIIRINDEILKEAAEIIRSELKDPRIKTMITVTRVNTTNDLKYCKIYVSIMGDEAQKKEAMEGLTSSMGFIRRQLAARVNLRITPELSFVLDDSLDVSMKISKMLDDLK